MSPRDASASFKAALRFRTVDVCISARRLERSTCDGVAPVGTAPPAAPLSSTSRRAAGRAAGIVTLVLKAAPAPDNLESTLK